MVIQQVNTTGTKKVTNNNNLMGQPTQNTFANRLKSNSIFTIAKEKEEPITSSSSSSSSSSWYSMLSDAGKGITNADKGSDSANAADKGAKDATGQVKTLAVTMQAKTLVAANKITTEGQQVTKLNQESQATGAEIETLTAERDTLVAAADTEPTVENPFAPVNDGTGAGNDSAFTLQLPGSPAPTAQGNGDSVAAPDAEPTVNTANNTTANTQPSENTENQDQIAALDEQIESKTGKQTQTAAEADAAVGRLKATHKLQVANLNNAGKALEAKNADAQNKIAEAQQGQQMAGMITQVGGTTTGGGATLIAMGSTPGNPSAGWMLPLGTKMVYVGGAATVGGLGYNMYEMNALNSANGEKNGVADSKAQLANKRVLLAQSYTKAMVQAKTQKA